MDTTYAFYFSTLSLENARCFGGLQELDLTVDGIPAQWSLLIGENGAGKTTLLECLAWMQPVFESTDSSSSSSGNGEISPLTSGYFNPVLPEEDDKILETLLRDKSVKVRLAAQLTLGNVRLHSSNASENGSNQHDHIEFSVGLDFDEHGQLDHFDMTKSSLIENLPEEFDGPLVVAYGANRHLGDRNLSGFDELKPLAHERLSRITELCDIEELLMGLDYAKRTGDTDRAPDSDAIPEAKILDLLEDAISRILPEDPAVEIEIYPPDVLDRGRPSGVYARTFSGLVRMSSLSLGYRTTASWVIDLAWRLVNRYRNSPNPLSEPAVVLIDEIDLHLHPRWQLGFMEELSSLFPATQFIATSHSPLIVQVAENAKLILLEKQEGHVNIENDPDVPRSLRVDQILTSLLFGVPISRNPSTQRLLDQRAELLDKMNLTEEEENLLRDIQRQIDELQVAHDNSDEVAMDLIRRFAARLEQEEANGQ